MVESKLPKRRGIDANFLEISTASSMTVWEFKELVAKYTNSSPLCIDLKRGDSKKQDIKDFRHCKLLEDLKFENGESLICSRAIAPPLTVAALLDSEGGLVAELKTIVTQWFIRYSVDVTKEELLSLANEGPEATRPSDEEAV